MDGMWVELRDFPLAMRDVSDWFSLGLSDMELKTLEDGLDSTWHMSEPWLPVPNHGPTEVAVEIAMDEIPGVAFRVNGVPPEQVDQLRAKIVARYWPPGIK
jgi:hypothetical protein